ncbi:MAG: hypothetical protein A2161_02860 [Candidatus Schekmanbacteria bacterium RBG_13_48_7]|uniref:Peptidase S55 domain-containing protein n=1 Tax=Candidatus Schekmanbacteria bacterium RBG_13_48_7 TaxID=1817878 RepID=A0A1F7RTN6_9BACT|nr:MAG: hypothetical protein A2161_02860 [Candidatus Schekmanbacteria bacterium RBG_13_48_7]
MTVYHKQMHDRIWFVIWLSLLEIKTHQEGAGDLKFYKFFIFIFLLCLFMTGYPMVEAEQKPAVNEVSILKVDDLKPGMTGIGKTVFQGTKVEEFDVEILGILKQNMPKSAMILIKVSGGPLEKAGVIAGMSGSPIFIDGKIIGALAYGWWFTKEAIAGVTPIEDMLPLLDMDFSVPETLDIISPDSFSSGHNAESAYQSFQLFQKDPFADYFNNNKIDMAYSNMRFLPMPLVISGIHSPDLMPVWQKAVEPFGFNIIQGGNIDESAPASELVLESGSAVGVQLIGGDLDMKAMGTLTQRIGDKIIAFGHSMFDMGHVDLPMVSGSIQAIMPSMLSSFKMGSTVQVVGSIRQDRAHGVAGILGSSPFMIPFTMNIQSLGNERSEAFNFKIARVPGFTSLFLFFTITDTVWSHQKSYGQFYAKLTWNVDLEGLPPIKSNNLISGLDGIEFASAKNLVNIIHQLEMNPFQTISIKSIELNMIVAEKIQEVQLETARLLKTEYRPGENMDIYMQYRPYKQTPKKFTTQISLPEDINPGNYELTISDASKARMNNFKRAPSLYDAENINQFIEKLNDTYAENQLILEIWENKTGLAIQGTEFSRIPGSIFQVYGSATQSGLASKLKKSLILRKIIDTNYEISGFEIIPFTISSINLHGR